MRLTTLTLTIFIAIPVTAETIWSDFSVSLLKGGNYEVGDSDRVVATFEHAAGLSWGDSFLFVDRLESNNGDTETYGEWSPRLKLSNTQIGILEHIYLSGTVEFGEGFTHYLAGVGTNVTISGFDFFKVSIYYRNNDGNQDNGEQITLSWGVPVGPLYYDGFIDFTPSTSDAETTMNFTSQLKYDLGSHFSIKNKLYVGIEYAHWDNKFGIDGVNERNVNALIKYHF